VLLLAPDSHDNAGYHNVNTVSHLENDHLLDHHSQFQARRRLLRGFVLSAVGLPFLGKAALSPSRLLAATEEWPTKRWPTATPQSVGLDAEKLAEFDAEIVGGNFGYVDSLLVIRHGKAVYDRSYKNDYDKIYGKEAKEAGPLNALDHGGPYNYFNPWWHPFYRRGDLHTLQSVTKTVTSVVIGAASRRREFPPLDTPILKYFDEKKVANLDERKRRITIRHLLTMTAGLEWNEGLPYNDPQNSCSQMEAGFDWVKFTIDHPMSEEPGTRFNYNSGASQLLGHIFRVATGQDIEEYAFQHLFTPLGIEQYFWKRTHTGLADTEGGLYLRTHDLARIAYLFLKNGVWDGKQIVTPDWVKESVTPAIPVSDDGVKYGLKWWLHPYGPKDPRLAWAGAGFGGQRPIVIPDYDLVIVVTAWNILDDKTRTHLTHRVIIDRLLGAVRDSHLGNVK
jgi:CubicO group peptidase (beta-lactamase class C family)